MPGLLFYGLHTRGSQALQQPVKHAQAGHAALASRLHQLRFNADLAAQHTVYRAFVGNLQQALALFIAQLALDMQLALQLIVHLALRIARFDMLDAHLQITHRQLLAADRPASTAASS